MECVYTITNFACVCIVTNLRGWLPISELITMQICSRQSICNKQHGNNPHLEPVSMVNDIHQTAWFRAPPGTCPYAYQPTPSIMIPSSTWNVSPWLPIYNKQHSFEFHSEHDCMVTNRYQAPRYSALARRCLHGYQSAWSSTIRALPGTCLPDYQPASSSKCWSPDWNMSPSLPTSTKHPRMELHLNRVPMVTKWTKHHSTKVHVTMVTNQHQVAQAPP